VVTDPEAARAEVRKQKEAGYDWIKVYNGPSEPVYLAIVDEAKKLGMPVAGHVPKAIGIDKVLAAGGQRSIEHLDGYVPFTGSDHVDQASIDATVKAGVFNCPTLIVTAYFARMDDPA